MDHGNGTKCGESETTATKLQRGYCSTLLTLLRRETVAREEGDCCEGGGREGEGVHVCMCVCVSRDLCRGD